MAQTAHPGMNPRRTGKMTIADKEKWAEMQRKAKILDYWDNVRELGWWEAEMISIREFQEHVANITANMEGWGSLFDFSKSQEEQEMEDQKVFEAVDRRRQKQIQEMLDNYKRGKPSIEGRIRVNWLENAYWLFLINKQMIEQWLYGRQEMRCSLLCLNDYYSEYTDCSICDDPMDPPKTLEDEAEEDIEKDEKKRDDIKEEIEEVKEIVERYVETEKKIKKKAGGGTQSYTPGRGITFFLEENRKRKINSYLNFVSIMKWTGRRARIAKGYKAGEFTFWAEVQVGRKWFIFDFKNKFRLKDHLNLSLQKNLRANYLKNAQINIL